VSGKVKHLCNQLGLGKYYEFEIYSQNNVLVARVLEYSVPVRGDIDSVYIIHR
jgi:hypothetical protein